MRFDTKPHPFSCGIDLHARPMDVCILDPHGAIRLHRYMPARPATFLKAIAPSRDDLVSAVACLFPCDWLADLGAQAGLPCVLGPARSRPALPGGKATTDPIDAQKIAGRRRGAGSRRLRSLPPRCGRPGTFSGAGGI
jgi:hypothetical protein